MSKAAKSAGHAHDHGAPRPLIPALDFANRQIPAHGTMAVDFEQRVDFHRLREYRLARAMQALEATECGAFLLFDFYNIRYTTQTWIGGALGDKMSRYALLTRDGSPHIWDFGSAAKHHKLFAPWLNPDHSHAGMLGLRGAIHPEVGLIKEAVTTIKGMLHDAGLANAPIGVDLVEPAFPISLLKINFARIVTKIGLTKNRLVVSARPISPSEK